MTSSFRNRLIYLCPQFCSRSLDHNTTKIKYADLQAIIMKKYHKKVPVVGVTAEGV